MADLIYTVDYAQVKAANKAILETGSTAQKSAKVFEKAFKAVEVENKKNLNLLNQKLLFSKRMEDQQTREYAQARRLANEQNKIFDQSIQKSVALAREKDRLSAKFVTGAKAAQQYDRALEEINKAHKLGVINSGQHAVAVRQLKSEFNQFKSGTADWSNQFVQASNRGSKSMNRFGMYAQQVGYQVGDFFVQVQSGQSAMVAFAQQGTQLAGLLPGIAGAVVGIGLSFAGMVYQMLRAKNETKDTTTKLKGLEKELKDIDDALALFDKTRKAFAEGLTLEQSTASDTLKAAISDLESAQKALEELVKTNPLPVNPTGGTADSRVVGMMGSLGASANREEELEREKKVKEQTLAVEQAQLRVDRLANELAIKRQPIYEKELLSATQAYDLARLKARYGENSLEYLYEELRQRKLIEASQTKSLDLSTTQIHLINVVNEALADFELNQKVATSGAESLMAMWEGVKAKVSEAVNKQKEHDAFISTQQDRIDLLKIERDLGRESIEYLDEIIQQEADRLSSLVASGEILQSNADEILRVFIEQQNLTREVVRTKEALEAISNADMPMTAKITALAFELGIAADEAARLLHNLPVGMTHGVPLSGSGASLVFGGQEGDIKTKRKSGGGGGGGSSSKTLKEIEAEIKLKTELANALGVEGERLRMIAELKSQLGESAKRYSDTELEASANRILAYEAEQEALKEIRDQQEDLANSIAETMGDSFMSIVDGTKTVGEAFKDMAASIIKQLFEVLVVQRMVGSFNATTGKGSGIAGFLGPLMGGLFGGSSQVAIANANGNIFSQGSLVPFANGGVVSTATMFPIKGGTGLMGEAGPEAIMPLSRGRDGKLGVAAGGSGTTNQYFTINAQGAQKGVAEQIDEKLKAFAPKIVANSVGAVNKRMSQDNSFGGGFGV